MAGPRSDLQRSRDGETAVTQVELFFDLVFVFAVTQLSHLLLSRLSWLGALQTGLLFAAVWWAWIYTGWVTNWLDPDRRPVRLLLFALMALGLVLSAALPQAFGDRGMVFALAFSAMQLGRTSFMLWALAGRSAANERNFRRILAWLLLTSALWIAGAAAPSVRLPVWIAAVGVELAAPAFGFFIPGMGRSTTADWDVDGGHLAERCSAFILIALGESVTVTGAAFFQARWTPEVSAAFGCAFVGAIALWWTYFDTAAERTSQRVAELDDPGRVARLAYTYLHAAIVAGIIVWAVADERVLDDPLARADAATLWVLLGGPGLYLLGNGLFRRTLSPRFSPSHTAGLVLLALIGAAWSAFGGSRLLVGVETAAALVAVATIGSILFRRQEARRAAT